MTAKTLLVLGGLALALGVSGCKEEPAATKAGASPADGPSAVTPSARGRDGLSGSGPGGGRGGAGGASVSGGRGGAGGRGGDSD